MDSIDRAWLENRLHAAVDDDFYLDRDEEKRIKEEAAGRGIPIREIDTVVQAELKKTGSVSERQLVDDLDRLLHQFTDDDKLLDRKEERDAFDQVVQPAAGKRKGLDARVAEEYVASFCRVNGVRRPTDSNRSPLLLGIAALAVLAVLVAALLIHRSGGGSAVAGASGRSDRTLSETDRIDIDRHLHDADGFIERAQYTDPPEHSAKAELDEIAQIDPDGAYRSNDVNAIKRRIVDHYLALADESARARDQDGARRWLDRARLLKANSEGIDDKARSLGLNRR
ncbi:hypothetical protein [Sphingomonas sp. NPDC079357]|uniref:hypothetical protein n=1 Tax=Sphingomonas sp. NPDC079357 TaxID=3364518 RepID=UPI00384D07EF